MALTYMYSQVLDELGLRQRNGQRIYGGPPAGWIGPPPPRGCEVFVKIPRDYYEDELLPLLQRAGTVYELRMMMDFSGTNRGYCFAIYSSRQEAALAVKMLDRHEIRPGRFLGIRPSVDNCKLFIGGIPRLLSHSDVFEEMQRLTEGVVDVIVYMQHDDKTKNRAYAFVEYKNHMAAALARKKLCSNPFLLWGRDIIVDWAEPEPIINEEEMTKVKILFVRNLADITSEETLKLIFMKAAGWPDSVQTVKRIRDFAFIHFHKREHAINAMHNLNGRCIDGAKLDVTLAKPNPKHIFFKPFDNNKPASTMTCLQILDTIGASIDSLNNSKTKIVDKKRFNHSNNLDQALAYWRKKLNGCSLVLFLSDICETEGWKKPEYYLHQVRRTSKKKTVTHYVYKVIIHDLAKRQEEYVFQPLEYSPSQSKAMEYAAMFVLSKIRLSSLRGHPVHRRRSYEGTSVQEVETITYETVTASCVSTSDVIDQELARACALLSLPLYPLAANCHDREVVSSLVNSSHVTPVTPCKACSSLTANATHATRNSTHLPFNPVSLASNAITVSADKNNGNIFSSRGPEAMTHSGPCGTLASESSCDLSSNSGSAGSETPLPAVQQVPTSQNLYLAGLPMLVRDHTGQDYLTLYMPGQTWSF